MFTQMKDLECFYYYIHCAKCHGPQGFWDDGNNKSETLVVDLENKKEHNQENKVFLMKENSKQTHHNIYC